MLSHPVNEIEIALTLKALSPLIIKDGRYTDDVRDDWKLHKAPKGQMPNSVPVSQSSLEAVKAAVLDKDPSSKVNALSLYIPGSSLRGSWRSRLEASLRGMTKPEDTRVCNPFDEHISCSRWLAPGDDEDSDVVRSPHPYRDSCPVCRLFGSTAHASRISISDAARRPNSGKVVHRDHVSIDRKDGKVGLGPFRFLGILDADFDLTIKLRNFELWQLALVASLIKELEEGHVPLGSGKNKGYGKVKATVGKIDLTYINTPLPIATLTGVAEHPAWGTYFQAKYEIKPYAGGDIPLHADFKQNLWRSTATLDNSFLNLCRDSIQFDPVVFPNLNARHG